MIKKVNWPQAFGEVILLLLGAAIALGIDGWNDRRLDRIAERESLASLESDFEETRDAFALTRERTVEIRDLNLRLLGFLGRSDVAIPVDSILEAGLRPFFVYRFYPVMGTYHDLVNSGQISLIQSDSLRMVLAEFEVSAKRMDQTVDEGYNQWNQLIAPFLLGKGGIRELVGAQYRGLELPDAEMAANLGFLTAGGFSDLLTINLMAKQDVILGADGMLERIDRILRLIAKAQEGAS